MAPCAGACGLGTTVTIGAPLNAESVPSSLEKMNRAALGEPTPLFTTKPAPPLQTMPVGLPCAPPAPGTVNTAWTALVPTLNSVDLPVPLSEIHQGVVGPATSPQAFTRLGSVWSAGIAPSETRLCCAKNCVRPRLAPPTNAFAAVELDKAVACNDWGLGIYTIKARTISAVIVTMNFVLFPTFALSEPTRCMIPPKGPDVR